MALIPCSFCGEMISDQALSCPKCGAPLNKPVSQPTYFSTPQSNLNEQKINTFLQIHSSEFPAEKIPMIKELLRKATPATVDALTSTSFQNPTILLIVSIFLGELGVDRFMLGEIGIGLLKLITCGGLGIWAIIDWFLIVNKTRNKNFDTLMSRLR